MTGEELNTIPNVNETNDLDNKKSEKELLVEGSKIFAENISKIIESAGLEGARDYIKDLLSDIEGKFPDNERAAVFEILANEEELELNRNTIIEGRHTLEAILNGSRVERQLLDGEIPRINLREPLEIHRAEIESKTNGSRDIDSKRLGLQTEVIADTAKTKSRKANKVVEELNLWFSKQKNEAEKYFDLINRNEMKRHVISRAKNSLKPYYEGDEIDLNSLISNSALESVLSKIQLNMNESDDSSSIMENSISNLAINHEGVDRKPLLLAKDVQIFLDEYLKSFRSKINEAEGLLEENMIRLRKFSRNGEEFLRIRNVDEIRNLVSSQKRLLEEAADQLNNFNKVSVETLGKHISPMMDLLDKLTFASVVNKK